MKVLFDAYWWEHGSTAVRRVMREIVTTWVNDFPQDEIGLVVRSRHLESVREQVDSRVELYPSRLFPQALLATLGTTFAARRFRPDLLLTHNYASLSPNSAVYIHDLMFKTNPEWFTKLERLYFAGMAPLARQASMVFTSSSSEAERIRRFVRNRPVKPVGIGIARELLESEPVNPAPVLVPRGFMLAVGRLNARKNLKRVILAAMETGLASRQFPLVVAGVSDGANAELPEVASSAIADGRLIILGFVTDPELNWLYSNARFTAYFSMDEGYGMPPLESLALGTPVVVSDIAVMHENLQEYAIYGDPTDSASIGAAMRDELLLELDASRVELLKKHGTALTWTAVVREVRARALEPTDA